MSSLSRRVRDHWIWARKPVLAARPIGSWSWSVVARGGRVATLSNRVPAATTQPTPCVTGRAVLSLDKGPRLARKPVPPVGTQLVCALVCAIESTATLKTVLEAG